MLPSFIFCHQHITAPLGATNRRQVICAVQLPGVIMCNCECEIRCYCKTACTLSKVAPNKQERTDHYAVSEAVFKMMLVITASFSVTERMHQYNVYTMSDANGQRLQLVCRESTLTSGRSFYNNHDFNQQTAAMQTKKL